MRRKTTKTKVIIDKWPFGGYDVLISNKKGLHSIKSFDTKPQALKFAKSYMKKIIK